MKLKRKPQWRPWEVRDARNVTSLPRKDTSGSRTNPRPRFCGRQLAGSQRWGCPSPPGSQHNTRCPGCWAQSHGTHRAVGRNGPQVGFSPTLLSLCLLPFSSSSLFKWETCRCRTKEHFVVSACLLAFMGTQFTVPGVSEKTLDLGFCTMMLE